MTYQEINSVQNPTIKQIVQLHSAKGRAQHNQFIAQGLRICTTLAQSKQIPLLHIYVTKSMLADAQSIAPQAPITIVTNVVMKKISTSTTPAGIVCVFGMPQKISLQKITTPGLVLVGLTDPGNIGTLIRTAAALAIKTIILVEGADVFNPKVVQASAGTIGMVNLFQCTWSDLITHARNNKISLSALVVHGGKKPNEIKNKNTLLIVGSEAHGLTSEQQKDCDQLITLPMPGGTESLNAAIAGSIALYLISSN